MDRISLDHIIELALKEDIPRGDVTTDSIISPRDKSRAVIFTKEPAVLCGVEIVSQVFRRLDSSVKFRVHAKDGDSIKRNSRVITLKGKTRAILSAERTALNFLSYLSAIATQTKEFVDQTRPYKVRILDTRKTTPTLRFLERYAVRCGGGYNHRDNLSEMAMIKDNHLLCSKNELIGDLVGKVRQSANVAIVVEVDDLKQLKEALMTKIDVILLDNMTPATVRKAVIMRDHLNSGILLEVSGGIQLNNVRAYARTGVERISIGGLTQSRRAIDFSMEIAQ